MSHTPPAFTRFRIASAFPVLVFALLARSYAAAGNAYDLFWLCNISNLLLSVGLLFRLSSPIWISTLWLIVGTPLWIWDDWSTGQWNILHLFTHVFGALLGLAALRTLEKRRSLWIPAILYLACVQALSRWLTPPELNVNLSFTAYGGLREIFPHYWVYWLANLALFSAVLFGLERLLERRWLKRP